MSLQEHNHVGSNKKKQVDDEPYCGAYGLFITSLVDYEFYLEYELLELVDQRNCRFGGNNCRCILNNLRGSFAFALDYPSNITDHDEDPRSSFIMLMMLLRLMIILIIMIMKILLF